MLHTFIRFARFIENYRYYRSMGFYSKVAWNLASRTFPE